MILNFLTTYVNRSGKVVYDRRLIAWNYLKGWFILDLSAAIPFELLHALNVTTGIRINLLKLARMLRLARLLQKIDRYSQYSAVVLALLMSMFTLVAHWFACIWYVIGRQETSQHPTNWSVGQYFIVSCFPFYHSSSRLLLFSSFSTYFLFTFTFVFA